MTPIGYFYKMAQVLFLSVVHKILASYKHAKLYENLTCVRMRPAAIVLNYTVHDIRNDIRQIIYIYI